MLYSVVCAACGFQGPEQKRYSGTSYGTVIIAAIWEWNLAHYDEAP